ncbi:MAG: xanthine dehydrogenase FAD-binding subunit XdhB [Tissierellia bacterium]|nr:xanthine dehydrogenase FAD-binding subunit XdhB [Tissierellia bacterium]
MYDIKALYEANTKDEAIELLKEHPNAKIIAGGSDILLDIRDGKLEDAELVSIQKLDEIRGISLEEDGTIRIGSMSSFTDVYRSEIIRGNLIVLAEAVRQVGSQQIRNIGTIGGNTCNGITSADSAATLLAHNAIVEIYGEEGYRYVPLKDFYIKAKKVDLDHNEIQTAILIKKEDYEGYEGSYYKYASRKALDIATVSCSINLKLEDDKKTIKDLRIAYGVAGPVPLRAENAEKFMKGKIADKKTVEEFADTAMNDLHPRDSWRASKEFRVHMMYEMTKRTLQRAMERLDGYYEQ